MRALAWTIDTPDRTAAASVRSALASGDGACKRYGRQGRFVSDLEAADFLVFDDGRAQKGHRTLLIQVLRRLHCDPAVRDGTALPICDQLRAGRPDARLSPH
jgi:hypothetical protein